MNCRIAFAILVGTEAPVSVSRPCSRAYNGCRKHNNFHAYKALSM